MRVKVVGDQSITATEPPEIRVPIRCTHRTGYPGSRVPASGTQKCADQYPGPAGGNPAWSRYRGSRVPGTNTGYTALILIVIPGYACPGTPGPRP
eukprot:1610530-Rhodomonas_salina.1